MHDLKPNLKDQIPPDEVTLFDVIVGLLYFGSLIMWVGGLLFLIGWLAKRFI